jgi:hypothetical protein
MNLLGGATTMKRTGDELENTPDVSATVRDHHRSPHGSRVVGNVLRACLFGLAAAPAAASGGSYPAPLPTSTRVIEWDLPANFDGRPGAISMDPSYGLSIHSNGGNKLWFVTRDGLPRVFTLEPGKDLKRDWAKWTSWRLDTTASGPTGGLKKIKSSLDRRFVFVRTALAVQKIDTLSCRQGIDTLAIPPQPAIVCDITTFRDEIPELHNTSDVAIDNRHFVYTAVTPGGDPLTAYVQRLDGSASRSKCGGQPCPPAEIVRWHIGGGAGNCFSEGPSDPCIAGVAVHPKYSHLVYVSEMADNEITEIDTNSKSCSCASSQTKIRSWKLSALGPEVSGPRQLNIDQDGLIWVITSSNHLVSLNTKTNRMTKHAIPPGLAQDPFGVAPDGGLIGYTTNDFVGQKHKVAMVSPKGYGTVVPPQSRWVTRETRQTQPECVDGVREVGSVCPFERQVPIEVTEKTDGVFIEALVDQNVGVSTHSSRLPLGLTPDRDKAVGAFFYAVGEADGLPSGLSTINRVGFTRLPMLNQKGKHHRDDEDCDDDGKKRGHDDDDDDDGHKNHDDADDDGDGILDFLDDDNDNDGIKDADDRSDSREKQDYYSSDLASNAVEEFPVIAGAASTFVAVATASNPLSFVSIEIVNPSGLVVFGGVPTPGVATATIVAPPAGDYIVRVKNHSVGGAAVETMLLTRDLWSAVLPAGF